MQVTWSVFKSFFESKNTPINWIDIGDGYFLKTTDRIFELDCLIPKDGNPDQTDFETNFKDSWAPSAKPQEVVTQLEKPDKTLFLASTQADFSGNICVLSILVPGTFGDLEARWAAGGYAFTNIYGWGDRVTKIKVIDKDFVYAGAFYPATPTEAGIPNVEGLTWAQVMPDGVELGSYCDTELTEEYHGWRLWCDEGNQGGMDIDPLGGMAPLPALVYLVVTIEKTEASEATKASINVWWGKKAS